MIAGISGKITQYPQVLGGTTLTDTQQCHPEYLSGIDLRAHSSNHLTHVSSIFLPSLPCLTSTHPCPASDFWNHVPGASFCHRSASGEKQIKTHCLATFLRMLKKKNHTWHPMPYHVLKGSASRHLLCSVPAPSA